MNKAKKEALKKLEDYNQWLVFKKELLLELENNLKYNFNYPEIKIKNTLNDIDILIEGNNFYPEKRARIYANASKIHLSGSDFKTVAFEYCSPTLIDDIMHAFASFILSVYDNYYKLIKDDYDRSYEVLFLARNIQHKR